MEYVIHIGRNITITQSLNFFVIHDISEISWPKFLRSKLVKIEEIMEQGSVTECLCLRGPICPAIG